MKKIIIQFIVLFFFGISANVFSQTYIEQNAGVTVNLTSVCINPLNFNYTSSNYVWVCGYNGTVIKTTNAGLNWVNVSGNGIPNTVNLINIFAIDTSIALTAGNTGTNTYIFRTTNKGVSWTQVFTQSNGYINAIWMKNSTQGFMYGNPVGGRWSLWKTSNGGINWDSSGLKLNQTGSETGFNNSLCIVGNKIWFGTNNTRIYFSSNFGSIWQSLSTSPEVNSYAVSFYYRDSTYGYFGGANSYKTTNSGLNWTILTCTGAGNFCAFTYGSMEGSQGADFAVRNDSNLYGNNSQWGSNWMRRYSAPSGIYKHAAYSFNLNTGYSWAVRSNGGITKFAIAFGDVKKISSEIPEKFSLSQNYPNPFNPSTNIKYQIIKNSLVQLRVYDALGHEITELLNNQQTPGTYEVEWDASLYPSGVYFYQLKITNDELGIDFKDTKRMILMK